MTPHPGTPAECRGRAGRARPGGAGRNPRRRSALRTQRCLDPVIRPSTSCLALTFLLFSLSACEPVTAPDLAQWATDTRGYEIEELPVRITASYARGDDVYLGLEDGRIAKSDDRDISKSLQELGNPFGGAPRLVFITAGGVLFTSADHHPLYRADTAGSAWVVCLDSPVWRMEEDDLGNLYAGNYIKDDQHVATLYKSTDAGRTWSTVFREPSNHHIHTVRWDDAAKRLYIAYGDGPTRGEGYSDDRGATFRITARGPHHGHTDVTCTADYLIWCSDDKSGRVYRVSRHSGEVETLMETSQFMWFATSDDQQVYIGTVTAQPAQQAVLLASPDQGETWQVLLRTPASLDAYGQEFYGESRRLSASGWMYFTGTMDGQLHSYRVRRAP
jgi:hypothetical protein